MREPGGPSTQSGILYQNSVAALYLGRLCDAAQRPSHEQVIRVRVEAPTLVDDTVVYYADGHRVYIQAKENVRSNQQAWSKLWRDFGEQFKGQDFQSGQDRLRLHIGEIHNEHHALREMCERAASSQDYGEWQTRLNQAQDALLQRIRDVLPPELASEPQLLTFLGHVDVEIRSLQDIERDLVTFWMPACNKQPNTLFRLLRDRVGGYARHRAEFTAMQLREFLEDDDVCFEAPLDIEQVRAAVRRCGALLHQHKHTFGNSDKHLERSIVREIVTWMEGTTDSNRVAMLLDQAGMGKSVVLHDVLCTLETEGATVLAIKADVQLRHVASQEELQASLELPDRVERVVARLAVSDRVMVIVDQLDALSLSLARDQTALNTVLDLVAQLRLIPNVRILLSCRSFDYKSDSRLRRIDISKQFSLGELLDDEVMTVLQDAAISWNELSHATQELLRTPLHLELFLRAVGDQDATEPDRSDALGVSTLQELYGLLWQNVICRREPDAPPLPARHTVIRLMTERMNDEQRTSVPRSMFESSDTVGLERAAYWLASQGILVSGTLEWSFLHQTFFDYCYAKQFVERGASLCDTILSSSQGLSARPQLTHVLSYLRGSQPRRYLRELQALAGAPTLRFHLRDLLYRWFGSLQAPTDQEWLFAHRKLLDPRVRPQLLRKMHGNPGWFRRIAQHLMQELLAKDDQTLDAEVIPYLDSMINVDQVQGDVIRFIRPYLGAGDRWLNRLAGMVSRMRNWSTLEAAELFEQVLTRLPTANFAHLHQLDAIAAHEPSVGCRLIRFVFDRVLDRHLSEQENQSRAWLHIPGALDLLRNSTCPEALKVISELEPALYVETMLPWIERVCHLHSGPGKEDLSYGFDELGYMWYDTTDRVLGAFRRTFVQALVRMARTTPQRFRRCTRRLAALPYVMPQRALANVYRIVPELCAQDALLFLLKNQRRLNLGDDEPYDSAQLIRSIYPSLSEGERARLEAYILDYAPVHKRLGVKGLQYWGLEQFRLLQAVPCDCLSEKGLRRLREWTRKFPDAQAPMPLPRSEFGFVGSPISSEAALRMSDRAWLRAMAKYRDGVQHREFLKGGATELARLMGGRVKEEPERFYLLFQHAPEDVDQNYVCALLDGLAESTAPAGWLFDVVERLANRPEGEVRKTIAWALWKRVRDGIPDDVLDLLETFVRCPKAEDEHWWGENRSDLHNAYINTERGSCLRTLMRALDQRGSECDTQRKWEMIEFAARNESLVLRVGAVEELL